MTYRFFRLVMAIALILVITTVVLSGLGVGLLAIGIAVNRIEFAAAKEVFTLILLTLGILTGTAIGFYFGVAINDKKT